MRVPLAIGISLFLAATAMPRDLIGRGAPASAPDGDDGSSTKLWERMWPIVRDEATIPAGPNFEKVFARYKVKRHQSAASIEYKVSESNRLGADVSVEVFKSSSAYRRNRHIKYLTNISFHSEGPVGSDWHHGPNCLLFSEVERSLLSDDWKISNISSGIGSETHEDPPRPASVFVFTKEGSNTTIDRSPDRCVMGISFEISHEN